MEIVNIPKEGKMETTEARLKASKIALRNRNNGNQVGLAATEKAEFLSLHSYGQEALEALREAVRYLEREIQFRIDRGDEHRR